MIDREEKAKKMDADIEAIQFTKLIYQRQKTYNNICTKIKINGQETKLKIDTGSPITV